jgi:hypothetical protein
MAWMRQFTGKRYKAKFNMENINRSMSRGWGK